MKASRHQQTLCNRRAWLRGGALASAAFTCNHLSLALLAQQPHTSGTTPIPLTDAQEIALGRRFATVFEAESPILTNPLIDQHLNQLVRDLALNCRRPTLPYRVKVINMPTLNAASLPGGAIYIHRGLFEILATEDELVAVIAHEIGHIVARHAIHQLTFTLQAQALLKPLLDNLARQNGAFESILQQSGGAVALIARLAFSRHDELEADRLGFHETLLAGWDPRGFLKMFTALEEKESANASTHQSNFPTHPPTAERAAAIEHELTSVTIPEDARTDSLEFRACKQALALLSAHPMSPPS